MLSVAAQTINWKSVDNHSLDTKSWPRVAPATRAEQAEVRKLILSRKDSWCGPDESTEWVRELKFTPMPLAPGRRDFLVKPDAANCNVSGQGANAAQWIAEIENGHARVLGNFGGYFSHLEPATFHGLHDVVMAWHLGWQSYSLTYYRYNGTQYQAVATADVEGNENGDRKITPKKLHPRR
jgi:hypothetical protein